MPGAMPQAGPAKLCRKCKDKTAVHSIRSDHFCSECFCQFVATKTVKRLEVLNRDKRNLHSGRPNGSKTFYAGLSFGASSSALVDIMEQITLSRLSRGKDASFALHVVHIDTDLRASVSAPPDADADAERRLDRWRARYPRFTFERVPLVHVLALDTIDWAALQPHPEDQSEDQSEDALESTRTVRATRPATAEHLQSLLASLPSATSRRDILDLLVRRLLIARATASWSAAASATASATAIPKCDALLLGCSTTALAERTLVETAKGRGFSLPWQINDGPVDDGAGNSLPLYYPVRELLRNELVQYTAACQPALAEGDLMVSQAPSAHGTDPAAAAVVSHRDLSIEEVLARYFAEVEVSYPSVVANVVRTTAKLERHGHGHGHDEAASTGHRAAGCRVCGIPLDEAGNERWKGEMGRLDGPQGRPRTGLDGLCYGCDRSIHG